jgi:hypothetical protein
VFSQKVGVLPEKMFNSLLNDRLVAKGTVLEFITNLFKVGAGAPQGLPSSQAAAAAGPRHGATCRSLPGPQLPARPEGPTCRPACPPLSLSSPCAPPLNPALQLAEHPLHGCPPYAPLQEYLKDATVDDLVALLTKAKVAHRLLEFFPPSKRSHADLSATFKVLAAAPSSSPAPRQLTRHAATHPRLAVAAAAAIECS